MGLPGPDTGLVVVAIGGNALLREGDSGAIQEQEDRARCVLGHVAEMARSGRPLVVTHGNGPVVGNIVLRNEAARDQVTPMPLYIDDADSQGGIGFMLQSVLGNELRARKIERQVVSIVTQVVVDPADPAFHRPTKPIGPTFDEARAEALARDEDWYFVETSEGRCRRVVPSPRPVRIVELDSIRRLAQAGTLVVACGGGGVPVVESEDGRHAGIEAVIDKDLTSALLATRLDASALIILMEADAVYVGWDSETPSALGRVAAPALRSHLEQGEFAQGSIGPKVEAALDFVETTGRVAIVCQACDLPEALLGNAGTSVVAGV